MTHTPEPWHTEHTNSAKLTRVVVPVKADMNGAWVIIGDVGGPSKEANAHRIVACVNACEGISNEALEAGVVQELLEALLNTLPYVTDVLDNPEQLACFTKGVVQGHVKQIRDAIEKATGEKK